MKKHATSTKVESQQKRSTERQTDGEREYKKNNHPTSLNSQPLMAFVHFLYMYDVRMYVWMLCSHSHTLTLKR